MTWFPGKYQVTKLISNYFCRRMHDVANCGIQSEYGSLQQEKYVKEFKKSISCFINQKEIDEINGVT